MSSSEHDVANMRISYDKETLTESDLAATPLEQFTHWLNDAVAVGRETIIEPNAMVLSTSDAEGRVSSRTVLLKGIDERGLVFFTNYGSKKGQDIAARDTVSVVFPWYPLHRQVIVTGHATKVSRAETEEYFAVRPHLSQLGARVSSQSSVIASREVLEAAMAAQQAEFPQDTTVPAPENWGGYLISVSTMEFWQGRLSRLHDRLRYVAKNEVGDITNADDWDVIRLAP